MANIGLNEEDSNLNKILKEKLGFKDELDTYLFALAYAIQEQLPQSIVSSGTKWNQPDEYDLQGIVEILCPDRIGEAHLCDNLAHAGLNQIQRELARNPNLTVANLIKYRKN